MGVIASVTPNADNGTKLTTLGPSLQEVSFTNEFPSSRDGNDATYTSANFTKDYSTGHDGDYIVVNFTNASASTVNKARIVWSSGGSDVKVEAGGASSTTTGTIELEFSPRAASSVTVKFSYLGSTRALYVRINEITLLRDMQPSVIVVL